MDEFKAKNFDPCVTFMPSFCQILVMLAPKVDTKRLIIEIALKALWYHHWKMVKRQPNLLGQKTTIKNPGFFILWVTIGLGKPDYQI